jgi:phosphatidylglycerophosphate synthase
MKRSNSQRSCKERVGQAIETAGSVLSVSRMVGGVALAKQIEKTPNYQSWKLAKTFVVLAATDALDGAFARYGRKLQGKDEAVRRPFNAYIDQLADKVMITAVMAAIAQREKENGHTLYATTLETTTAVDTMRNIAVTTDRIIADKQNIDTRAQSGGKGKTVAQTLVTAAALSPVTKSPVGRAIVGAAVTYTGLKSVDSGLELHESFQTQRALQEEAQRSTAEIGGFSFDPVQNAVVEFQPLPLADLPHSSN